MAECGHCGRDMKTAEGCEPHEIAYRDGETRDAPRHDGTGSLGDPQGERCPDCAAEPGGVHHPGCDWARNPRTGGQLLLHRKVRSFVFDGVERTEW